MLSWLLLLALLNAAVQSLELNVAQTRPEEPDELVGDGVGKVPVGGRALACTALLPLSDHALAHMLLSMPCSKPRRLAACETATMRRQMLMCAIMLDVKMKNEE